MAAENIDIKMPLAIAKIPVRFIMFYIPELETAWFLALAALYPQEGNPPQGWSIAGMLNLHPDTSTGRHENSVWWAGITNCYWWLDHDTGIGGIIVAQVLPFLGTL